MDAILGSKEHEISIIDDTREVIGLPKKANKVKYKTFDIKENKEIGIKSTKLTTKIYIDKDTGEEKEATTIIKRVAHNYPRGWQRVFIKDLFFLLSNGFARNKELKIINYIFENTDTEHRFYQSQRTVSLNTEVSIPKVNSIFKKLVQLDIIQKVPNVVSGYEINPKIIAAYGNDSKNIELICRYEKIKENTDDNNDDDDIKIIKEKLRQKKANKKRIK